jgi:hypothetical protein
MDSSAAETAPARLAAAALALVQDPETRRVRVEDYLTVIAAATGEAAIVDAGIDTEAAGLAPGSRVFGDAIDAVLSGDTTVLASVPGDSVVGVLRAMLVPGVVPEAAFGDLRDRYASVAATVGSVPWGSVPFSVGDDHRPGILPLRAAFELRPAVEAAAADAPSVPRHALCAVALATALVQTRAALAPETGLALALDVVFGMAKTVPMTRAAYDAAAAATRGDAPGGR